MKQLNKLLRMSSKKKLILVAYLFIFMFIITAFKSIESVKADSNYSNYLTSESISVENDRALILLEESVSSNNYRNYYETGFLFPSKLRNEMYSTELTTNPSKYYVQQAYLDDLNSDYAFSDMENLGQYETNDYIENYSDIIENNGYYNNTQLDYTEITIVPSADILCNWAGFSPLGYPSAPHWNKINVDGSNTNGIGANHFISINTNDRWSFTDISEITYSNYYIDYIELKSYNSAQGGTFLSANYSLSFDSFNSEQTITLNGLWYKNYYLYWNNLNLSISEINNIEVNIKNIQLAPEFSTYEVGSVILNCYLLPYNITYPLKEVDNNYYNYITEGAGSNSLYPAEYSFTDDLDSSNPADFTLLETGGSIQVISDLDTHDKVVEIVDSSATASENPYLYNTFSSTQEYGIVEFWIRTNNIDKQKFFKLRSSGTNALTFGIFSGGFKYIDGAGWNTVSGVSPVINQWYHILFEFECGSGNNYGLAPDDFNVYIDGIERISDASFNAPATTLNQYWNHGYDDSSHTWYIDAVDYSWSDGYFRNRNLIDSSYTLNISSELQLETLGNSYDNLEKLELEYTFKSNNTSNLGLYLYNIFSDTYDLVDTNEITTSFQDFSYTFDLNYTYYSTLGFINFTFYTGVSYDSLISIDKISLRATFSNFSLNSDGYHAIDLKFNRKTSAATNRGNISFNMDLYENYFTYDYIENNVIETDYSKLNQVVNFSNNIEQIYECEIQYHIRYGLNTLDIDIVNTYIMVIINYNYTFELFEQLRFGNNDGNYFRAEFSYDSMNFNRLNNTGIFGNYSMNCLSGLRVLRADTSRNFNRYFTIPYFDEKISLTYSLGADISGSGSEPRNPVGTYWTYETFRLADSGNIGITVENWSVDFRTVEAEKYDGKYFYKSKTIRRSSLGNWKFTILEQKVSFNFLRNGIADIINLILLFFQYLFFLVTASLSYIFMFLGINILVLLWNVIVYWIFVALIWILWYFYSAIYWLMLRLYDALIWIYEVTLIPAYIWITEVAVPYLVEFIIIPAIAFTLTLIIWIITLGRLDFWELYEVVETQLYVLSDSFNVIMLELVDHIVEVVIFIGLYLLLIGMCYLKHIVVKVRGYVNRSNALEESLNAYLYPLIIFYKICLAIKQLIANWF